MASKSKDSDAIDWDVTVENLLLYALVGLKPVGVNRYFMMACIHDKFSAYINRQMTSRPIWDHLDTMYDMAALHESEIIPFPNEEVEFELPANEFDQIALQRFGVTLPHPVAEAESKASNTKTGKKVGSSKHKQSHTPVSSNKSKDPLKQTPTITPVSVKLGKATVSIKSDPNISALDSSNSKCKVEFTPPAKVSKIKRSASPLTTKGLKPEPFLCPQVKVEPATELQVKKATKQDTSSSSTSKKVLRQEQSASSTKHGKTESSENTSQKKAKGELETSSKKRKVSIPESPLSRRNSKGESTNGSRKQKSEPEVNVKKLDASSTKHIKTDIKSSHSSSSKGVKIDENDTQSLIGSAKTSRVQVKVEPVDSAKKRKRQKVEEAPKKTPPATKRRRT